MKYLLVLVAIIASSNADARDVIVDVSVGPKVEVGPRGTLVVGWRTSAEQAALDGGTAPRGTDLTTQIQRFVVVENVKNGRAAVRLPNLPNEALTFNAVYDSSGQFWQSLWGGVGVGNALGKSKLGASGTKGALVLDKGLRAASTKERCTGRRYRLLQLNDFDPDAAKQNPPRKRKLCVYLPKTYDDKKKKHYPVVYIFPGLFSSHASKLVGRGSYAETADNEKLEVILVGVDTRHSVGSTYFTSSPRTGDGLKWLKEKALPAVDAAFRTLPGGGHRALIGGSTGGFNAMRVAQMMPDYFGAVAALKPDGLDIEHWLFTEATDAGVVKPLWLAWMRLEAAVGGGGQLISYAAHFSPDARYSPDSTTPNSTTPNSTTPNSTSPQKGAPRGYQWPADLDTGRPTAVFDKWLAFSPIRLLDTDLDNNGKSAANNDAKKFARRFSGRIFLAVGRHDEFDLASPTLRFADALSLRGIHHTLHVDEGGHFSHGKTRQAAGLRFVVAAITRPGHHRH